MFLFYFQFARVSGKKNAHTPIIDIMSIMLSFAHTVWYPRMKRELFFCLLLASCIMYIEYAMTQFVFVFRGTKVYSILWMTFYHCALPNTHQSKNINFIEISLVFTAFIRQMPWNFGSYLALVKLRLGQMFCVCESVSYCDRLGLFWFSSDVKCEIPSKPFTRTILMEWDGHRNGEKERVRWGTKMARVFDLVCGMSNTHNIWWWTFSLYKYWTNGRTNEQLGYTNNIDYPLDGVAWQFTLNSGLNSFQYRNGFRTHTKRCDE